MSDEPELIPPSQDVADKIVLDLYNRIMREQRDNPLTLDQNWALAAITNKVTEMTKEQTDEVKPGLAVQIMAIAQYSFYLGRSHAKDCKSDEWRNSGEMRSYE